MRPVCPSFLHSPRRGQRTCGLLAALAAVLAMGCPRGESGPTPREQARRHVNLGVAYLAQFLPGRAAEEFSAAVALDPDNLAATVNLGVAARVAADLPGARRWLSRALELEPRQLAALYNLALVERLEGNAPAALHLLEQVRALDPGDVETSYNLGLVQAQLQAPELALAAFDRVLARQPRHASALYGKGRALLAMGHEDEALAALEASQALAAGGGLTTTSGQQYGEQGVHSLAVEDMPVDPPAPAGRPVTFRDITAMAGFGSPAAAAAAAPDAPGSGLAMGDLDGDGDLDLYLAESPGAAGIFLNDGGGRFTAGPPGIAGAGAGIGAGVSLGDYDNDGLPDLYAGRRGANLLLRNLGGAMFEDVTAAAGVGDAGRAMGVAFADLEHDGDVDILVTNEDQPGLVYLRNNGDSSFTDITAASGLALESAATGALMVDVDGDRDVDVIVAAADGLHVFLNQRDTTFVAAPPAWTPGGAGVRSIAVIDVGKDGRPDLVLSGKAGTAAGLWRNHGDGLRLDAGAFPGVHGREIHGVAVLDHDLDGFEDVAMVTAGAGLLLYRNLGQGRFADISAASGLAVLDTAGGRSLVAGDIDGDGDVDLVMTRLGRAPLVVENQAAPGNWLAVDLDGLHSNRTGIGARLALRAGGLWEQRVVAASGGYLASGPPRVSFGLGPARSIDAVSILWPGGVLQDELDPAAGAILQVHELDRKGSSCPSLFGWDGTHFAYLADFIGGGALGLFLGPGVIYTPDPEELHLVRPEVGLAADTSGRMALRLTNNLEEVSYVDSVALRAVDHPAGTVAVPAEGLRPQPPYPGPAVRLFSRILLPLAAHDGEGQDWTAAVSRIDRLYPTFPLHRRLGHARPHTLEVVFPPPPEGSRIWLWAQGTLEFSNSSPNLAASQGRDALVWPRLEILENGRPRLLEAALPVPMGVDKPVLVDLTGRVGAGDIRLRIPTSMEIYWDRLALAVEAEVTPVIHDLPAVAELRAGGFPMWESPDGRLPRLFNYQRRQPLDTWKRIPGRYTAFGSVDELLAAVDDAQVIMAPGDELAMEFDATALPQLGSGQMRTWMVHGWGYVKDTDLNSPGSSQVDPLPFVGMGALPPPAGGPAIMPSQNRVVLAADPLRRHPTEAAVAKP